MAVHTPISRFATEPFVGVAGFEGPVRAERIKITPGHLAAATRRVRSGGRRELVMTTLDHDLLIAILDRLKLGKATHACSEALQGNGLRPGLKPFGEENETPLELGCKRCHARSEAPQGRSAVVGVTRPLCHDDETLLEPGCKGSTDGLNLDPPLLRRCDYHRGDTQLLICVRHPQQIHRAEPLSNINENVQRQIKDTQRRKPLILRLRARLLHYRTG
ncbi:hypothetical protein NKJ32_33265 [Mesorhizobium sp. M0159]